MSPSIPCAEQARFGELASDCATKLQAARDQDAVFFPEFDQLGRRLGNRPTCLVKSDSEQAQGGLEITDLGAGEYQIATAHDSGNSGLSLLALIDLDSAGDVPGVPAEAVAFGVSAAGVGLDALIEGEIHTFPPGKEALEILHQLVRENPIWTGPRTEPKHPPADWLR